MKFFLSIFTLFAVLSTTAQTKVYNDPNAKTRTLSGSFSKISVSGGVDLQLTQGNDIALALSVSDPRYEERFKTEVVDGVLRIYYDNKGVNGGNDKNRKLKAYLSVKNLDAIKVAAGSRLTVTNSFNAPELDLSVSSGAMLTGTFKTTSMVANVSSGAIATVSGSADKFSVTAESGAVFKAYGLVTQRCTAAANSGAVVNIEVQKELNASANSGGAITYKGNATVNKGNVNSGGSVRHGK